MSWIGTPCAIRDCNQRVGAIPYRLLGRTENYCSRECMSDAHDALQKHKLVLKGSDAMNVPAPDFGPNSGVVRGICDLCQGPLTLRWVGKNGKDYCSRTHQKT